MKKEQIEQAAARYAESIAQSDRNKIYSKDDFMAGAEWRISSVWHKPDKLPTKSSYLVALRHDGSMEILYYNIECSLYEKGLKTYYKLWAYVDDIMPEKEGI